ncbi:hypothetical protein AMS68_004531 [Peltaster fructicola]|uniref:Uncharacterized protein n=1 Tax=Peltaster fructicola TaxID=286661 RepID=A0A6H0XWB4_9PEZI|nr:hypothetical protein AMS68_004531 [Peltaster fructicola]
MADLDIYWQYTLTTLGWISYPFGLVLYYVAIILLFIGKLLYGPISTFLQPFIYVGRFFLFLITLPYHLLAKFEPLYNFLGVAAIIGLLIGLGLHYSARNFDNVPDVSNIITSQVYEYFPWLKGRTVKQYREGKGKQGYASMPSSGYASLSDSVATSRRGKSNLIAQTILEEVDSDF